MTTPHPPAATNGGAVRYFQRLTALQTVLTGAATRRDRHELRRSAEMGQHVLWDAAGLLHHQETLTASAGRIGRERLMVQLADQVTSACARLTGWATPCQQQGVTRSLGPYPPAPISSAQ
ncbi:hypothetical protein ABZ341_43385 [Streptomyces sp. NPDC006173]|uniref:hypothetical protein n=1 Tax=Streptomyces sp. NPDC006173 TaxID=3155349 RepID=UPI0033C08852